VAKFVVYRQEVHIQPVEVEAGSAKEARKLVEKGKGEWDESLLYFSFDLDPDLWTVEPGWVRQGEPSGKEVTKQEKG